MSGGLRVGDDPGRQDSEGNRSQFLVAPVHALSG
jgi:hypothetical protein